MDIRLILTRTAKGVLEAKNEDGKLGYDAVRLLRMVNGKASIAELRAQLSDLPEIRFQKALSVLEDKGLVRALPPSAPDPAERLEMPRLEKQLQELGQDFMQSLDFTTLERQLLEAMRSSPTPATPSVAIPEPAQPPPPRTHAGAIPGGSETLQPRSAAEAQLRAELLPLLRPKLEAELRTKLTAALRPLIEESLTRQLIVTLRPALEAEIRTKLTAALRPRIEHELRARLKQSAAAQPEPTNVVVADSASRLLECMRETVFQTDLAGSTVYVNERWSKLTGYAREETQSRPFTNYFVAGSQESLASYLDGVCRGVAVPVVFEAHLARKSGTPLRVAIRAAPYITADGAIAGVCGTLRGMRATPVAA